MEEFSFLGELSL